MKTTLVVVILLMVSTLTWAETKDLSTRELLDDAIPTKPPKVGDYREFITENLDTITVKCLNATDSVYVFGPDSMSVAAQKMSDQFPQIYEEVELLWGEFDYDPDPGHGFYIVLDLARDENDIAGVHRKDFYPKGTEQWGNGIKVMFFRPWFHDDDMRHTVRHELQHLFAYSHDLDDTHAMYEMMANLSGTLPLQEYLGGYAGPIDEFVDWRRTDEDYKSSEHFGIYLYRTYGTEVLKRIIRDPKNGFDVIVGVTGDSWESIMRDYEEQRDIDNTLVSIIPQDDILGKLSAKRRPVAIKKPVDIFALFNREMYGDSVPPPTQQTRVKPSNKPVDVMRLVREAMRVD
jgi:hypothetical protein